MAAPRLDRLPDGIVCLIIPADQVAGLLRGLFTASEPPRLYDGDAVPDAAEPLQVPADEEIGDERTRFVLNTLSVSDPMSEREIATATGYIRGKYLHRMMCELWGQGLVVKHAKGWLRALSVRIPDQSDESAGQKGIQKPRCHRD